MKTKIELLKVRIVKLSLTIWKQFNSATSGKIYSKNGQYSIDFDNLDGAQIYDEFGGFVANEGGFFGIGGFEYLQYDANDGMIRMHNIEMVSLIVVFLSF